MLGTPSLAGALFHLILTQCTVWSPISTTRHEGSNCLFHSLFYTQHQKLSLHRVRVQQRSAESVQEFSAGQKAHTILCLETTLSITLSILCSCLADLVTVKVEHESVLSLGVMLIRSWTKVYVYWGLPVLFTSFRFVFFCYLGKIFCL